MSLLELHSVSKAFSGTLILDEITFQVHRGEIVCLLGPSGCGKTTLLRIIAGLERADCGHVSFDGRRLDDVPVHQRGFGLMFQDYALFPHRDVAANVAFGLRMQHLTKGQIEARVAEMLDLVGLATYQTRRVYDLSGGEQQRVALARSLAPGPRLLMLDEPLGSLDRALREELLNELRAILQSVEVTVLYVTHDQQEAFAVADRLIVMRLGRIIQAGSPQQVYRHPAQPWVARFLGLTNLVPGRIVAVTEGAAPVSALIDDKDSASVAAPSPTPSAVIETPIGRLHTGTIEQVSPPAIEAGQSVTILLRPEGARFAADCPSKDDILIEGITRECSFRGRHCRLLVEHSSGLTLSFDLAAMGPNLPRPGEPVALALDRGAISFIPREPNEH